MASLFLVEDYTLKIAIIKYNLFKLRNPHAIVPNMLDYAIIVV